VDWSRAHIAEEAVSVQSGSRAARNQQGGAELPSIVADEHLQVNHPDGKGPQPGKRGDKFAMIFNPLHPVSPAEVRSFGVANTLNANAMWRSAIQSRGSPSGGREGSFL
jgi:hypothetical protein